ncbi:MAG: hypothetical protein CR997_06455 [Acidobacteria bacterium]|nr:MAG: hypothetical protein CR997_06455 [Acidobacteriota bacterium]
MEESVLSEICIARVCRFKASHFYWINGLGEEKNREKFGDYINEHDHDWQVTVYLKGAMDPEMGMLIDLAEVDRVLKEKVLDVFHRRNLNRAHPFFKEHLPTTENFALLLSKELSFESAYCVKIRVSESPFLYAEWFR